jgi:hemerythrin-like domain-containing protein
MVKLLEKELKYTNETNKTHPEFIKIAIDFFRIYADKCHHGKEEDILFRELHKKEISKEHLNIMNNLIDDHKKARDYIKQLEENNKHYIDGNLQVINRIQSIIQKLIELYPQHIDIENHHFFGDVMQYFSEDEKRVMSDESFEFDKKMIHRKYTSIIEFFENKQKL